MGLFSKPKCPHCGGVLSPTGYSFPYPALRCKACIARNTAKKEQLIKNMQLEKRIQKLENQLKK